MYVGKEDRHCYYVNVFNGYQRVLINEDGYGDFYCEDKNFAVYVKSNDSVLLIHYSFIIIKLVFVI